MDTIAADIASTTVKMDPDGAITVTVKQVNNFQRGHRRDLTVFKHFNGVCIMCLCAKEIGTAMLPMIGLSIS